MATNTTSSGAITKGGIVATPNKGVTDSQIAAAKAAGWTSVTSDSSATRASNNATGNDISRYERGFDSSALRRASEAEARQIQAERAALDARRNAEIGNIEQSFSDVKEGTMRAQEGEFAGRATNLITSGGGFLGATQSQQGVLQQLRETQRGEISALETKKQSAIQQARNAYDDKDFALARDLVKSAREVEQQIYTRKKDYADREIQLSRYAEQDKQTSFKNSLDIVDRTAAGIYDAIQGMSPAAQSTYITSMASSIGVDPNILQSKVSEIAFSKKDQDRSAISVLAGKYPSANIDPSSDTFASATAKVRNSREYKLDIQKAEADIANVSSLISDRANGGSTFGSITAGDKANGMNWLIMKKASEDDIQKFQTDRNFQAWVLNKVKLTQ